ncbi:MAG TPA: hypothetical protein VMX75_05300 [Spirochaetia bacterium]|nr:hypothetical protein [Spirochaetia bacterium]
MMDQGPLAILSLSGLSFLLFLLNFLSFLNRKKENKRPARLGWTVIFLLVSIALLSVYFGFFYSPPSPYALRIDAIRATSREAKAVDLSLRIYNRDGSMFKRVFDPGVLDPREIGTRWITLNDSDFKAIPSSSLSNGDRFFFKAELNPNRLLTLPDAIFEATLILTGPTGAGRALETSVVRSKDNGDYELRLEVRSGK